MRKRYQKGPMDKFVKNKKSKNEEEDERLNDPFADRVYDTSNIVNTNAFVFDANNFINDDEDEKVVVCNNFVWNPESSNDEQTKSVSPIRTDVTTLEPFEDIVNAIEQTKENYKMSGEQLDICRFVYDGTNLEGRGKTHLVIDSVAGSGKTTSLLQCLWFIPPNANVLLLSFNKNIQNALQTAIGKTNVQIMTRLKRNMPNCTVLTCHSHGLQTLRNYFPYANNAGEQTSDNKMQIVSKVIQETNNNKILEHWRWHLVKMLRLLLNLAVDCPDVENFKLSERFVVETGRKYGLTVPDTGPFQRSSLLMASYMNVLEKSLQQCVERKCDFDYNDMLWLPLRLGLKLTQYDYVLVDESQDLNWSQILMVQKSLVPPSNANRLGGKAIFVGDQNQSIYGFRGVETNAMQTVADFFDAEQLPLHTCWRCPLEVIQAAQQIVPRIQPSPFAERGLVSIRDEEDILDILSHRDEDQTHAVLCRTNAPLITLALDLLDRDIPFCLSAPSLKETLHSLANLINEATWIHTKDMVKRTDKYIEWKKKSGKEIGEEQIEKTDQLESLKNIIKSQERRNHVTNITTIHRQIDRVFGDVDTNTKVIRLSTIHSVKGMEFDCVYIIATRLLPHPFSKGSPIQRQQENNLKYVAYTRAKKKLYYMMENTNKQRNEYDYDFGLRDYDRE